MEKTCLKIGLFLIAVVVGIQTHIFLSWHDGREYSGSGAHMAENTWLFNYDELTISVRGYEDFGDVWLYRNGERVVEILNEPHTITVNENDLMQLKAAANNEDSVEVRLDLKYNVFDERFYVDLFDFHGGEVIVGRFITADS